MRPRRAREAFLELLDGAYKHRSYKLRHLLHGGRVHIFFKSTKMNAALLCCSEEDCTADMNCPALKSRLYELARTIPTRGDPSEKFFTGKMDTSDGSSTKQKPHVETMITWRFIRSPVEWIGLKDSITLWEFELDIPRAYLTTGEEQEDALYDALGEI